MPYKILFHSEKCVACNACVIACIDQNDTMTDKGETPNRKFLVYEKWSMEDAAKVACLHCTSPKCIGACPNGCLKRDEETSFIVFDDENCIGCAACVNACPFGSIHLNPNNKIRKCDGCSELVKNGRVPVCIPVCPTKAIELIEA